MSIHEAGEFGRVMRADRCHCGEYPQACHHTGRAATWFVCSCGRISEEALGAERAVYNWNQAVRRGC